MWRQAPALIVSLPISIAISVAACGSSAVSTPTKAGSGAPVTRRILYLTQSAGYRHDVLPLSVQILQDLGRQSGAFDVTATEDSAVITRDGLTRYDAVVFFTSGELPMREDQKAALLEFVRSGKGFAGIHSATDTFYQWPEYGALIGAYFDGHPWHQDVTIRVEDPGHAATASLPSSFRLNDEIYQFRNWSRGDVHVLLSLDPASVDLNAAGVNRLDRDFALAWTRTYGQGRVFYTALGHEAGVWQDARFQRHLTGGIRWAMGQQ
jgi:type 1 glutamine amidotransferase